MDIGIGNGWRVASSSEGHFPGFINSSSIPRKRIQMGNAQKTRLIPVSSSKKANLSASKKQRIKLPIPLEDDVNEGKKLAFGEFLNHPSGMEAVLNVNALQSYHSLGDNTYRCRLPKIQLLSFEAAPVVDLRVTPMNQTCTVELLSCKLEGSEILNSQSDSFSAVMINHMTWGIGDPDPFLEVDVKLDLTLEISTMPFTMLPVSAVELPGNLVMQTLIDSLVPLLLQQLMKDYEEWVHQQQQLLQSSS
ncbi:PREDICTED: uncharacterized protein LOC104803576 [Tarenaya hassleriana]|uniref:uncharacterized protein LOC104803576 n=1 Tax=Tarenaya hassleriana TaxID=28532 RepID=UPI00053C32EE|nr:PREDICTED: uncharacterized protein LOC104803576 [Tarenaya hassleriana]